MLKLNNQFLAGLLTLAITVLTAGVAIPEADWFKPEVIWQFGGMAVSTAAVIFLPLAKGGWAGALKIGSAIVAVIVSNVVAVFLAAGVFNFTFWMLLILAILNVVAGELGVQARVVDAKIAIASPSGADTIAVQEIDPAAANVASHQLEGVAAKLGH